MTKDIHLRVVMVVLNSFTNDARVLREARTLSKHGYHVTVICLHDGRLREREVVDGINVQRIRLRTRGLPKLRSVQLIKYAEFAARAMWLILSIRPAVVHTHDLVALPIGYLARRPPWSKTCT